MEFRNLNAVISKKVMLKPRLQIRYPQLSGLPDRKAQTMMNDRIMRLVYQMIQDQGYVQDTGKEMNGTYEVRLNGDGLISIVFQSYARSRGDVNGRALQKSLTMDLRDGREYRVRDLFRQDSEFKPIIDAILLRQIEESDVPISEATPFRGVGPDQDFYLTRSELVVYFQQYEYTPETSGFPTFPIAYSELTDIAAPEGPMARLEPVAP
ncbi:DUF3298 and DUF4163 domain-containing protein [Paenibacillus ginsengarvi]|uniref:DUF3298 domain-containing protein n=1 Tax=Paenibacillus ginsengarvi TaxID=400777 RepID=A0A3B0BNA8_9BACL|nr:DUF3298 and DUF4163 domain-containing protein [Paenibacillus ginsengarvi]RKN74161.1 DUF3298 domain-containing protein [Paenibacillus ginsengarvi]